MVNYEQRYQADNPSVFVVVSRGEARAYDEKGKLLGHALGWSSDIVEIRVNSSEKPQVEECIRLNNLYNESRRR